MKTTLLAKILPKNGTVLYAVVCFIMGVILFIVNYLSSKDALFSVVFSSGMMVFVFLFCILAETLGKKRHYSILESKGFQGLISRGFRIVELNEYKGLFGVYDSYLFDIYYDWSTFVRGNAGKAIIFNVYFIPPTLNSGKTDHARLKALSEKYNISNWKFKSYNFWWREGNIIMKNGVGVFNLSFEKMTRRMEIVLDILRAENLKPLDSQTLDSWRKEFPMSNIPEIELYYNKKDNR